MMVMMMMMMMMIMILLLTVIMLIEHRPSPTLKGQTALEAITRLQEKPTVIA